jgi:hypothetical protein
MHYLNKYQIAVLKALSKLDLRRSCRVVNATPLARMGAPIPEEAGWVDIFETGNWGGTASPFEGRLEKGRKGMRKRKLPLSFYEALRQTG